MLGEQELGIRLHWCLTGPLGKHCTVFHRNKSPRLVRCSRQSERIRRLPLSTTALFPSYSNLEENTRHSLERGQHRKEMPAGLPGRRSSQSSVRLIRPPPRIRLEQGRHPPAQGLPCVRQRWRELL